VTTLQNKKRPLILAEPKEASVGKTSDQEKLKKTGKGEEAKSSDQGKLGKTPMEKNTCSNKKEEGHNPKSLKIIGKENIPPVSSHRKTKSHNTAQRKAIKSLTKTKTVPKTKKTCHTTPSVQTNKFVFAVSGMQPDMRAMIIDLIQALTCICQDTKVRILDSSSVAWSECSHVITPDDGNDKRTLRVIFALCKGTPIVSMAWVFASLEEGRWLQHEKYISTRYGGPHTHSREYLLKSLKIFLGPTSDPPKPTMEKLIIAAGGKISSSLRGAELCLVFAEEGESWFTKEVGKGGVLAAELLRMGQAGKVLTQKWLFDSIEKGSEIEDVSAYAIGIDLDADNNAGSSPGW